MTDFLVKRDDLRECRIAESARAADRGRARRCSGSTPSGSPPTTSPTRSSARRCTTGTSSRPRTAGAGCRCGASPRSSGARPTGVEAGTRVYGYLPPSSHLVVTPADAGEAASSTAHRTGRRCPPPTTATWRPAPTRSTGPDTEEIQMLLRPLFFTSFLIDDQLADEGLADARADPDLQRLEQDRDRRRLHAGPARRGRAGRPHLAAQRRVRRGPGDLRPHGHLRRDRLARAGSRHLRRHRRRRRGAPRGPLALRRPSSSTA